MKIWNTRQPRPDPRAVTSTARKNLLKAWHFFKSVKPKISCVEVQRLSRNTCGPCAAVAACMHDAEPPLGGLEAGKGERARRKKWKRLCMCVLKTDVPRMPRGQVQSSPEATDACSERVGKKKNLSLSSCPCNSHQLFQRGTGGGGQVTLAVLQVACVLFATGSGHTEQQG